MTYLLFLLAAYGITFGIQNKIPWIHGRNRYLEALLQCPYCFGFWAGLMCWGLSWPILGKPIFPQLEQLGVAQAIAGAFAWAMASAAFCYVVDTCVEYLESRSE